MNRISKLYVMVALWAVVISLAIIGGCGSVPEQQTAQPSYSDPVCSYEATKATATMGCTGCIYANIDKITAWRNVYGQCISARAAAASQFVR